MLIFHILDFDHAQAAVFKTFGDNFTGVVCVNVEFEKVFVVNENDAVSYSVYKGLYRVDCGRSAVSVFIYYTFGAVAESYVVVIKRSEVCGFGGFGRRVLCFGFDDFALANNGCHTFKNGLHFGVTASVADDKTEVTKWTYNTKIPSYGATGWWDKSAYKEGMVLGDIWGLQFDRFLTEDDFNADGSLKAGLPDQTKVFPAGYQFAPGDVLYKDLDNNGEIVKQTNTNDKGDLSVIGNALPRLQFGLNLDAAWKGFDISMFFQGVAKRKLWAAGNQVLPGFTTGEPFYKGAEDYWTPENTDAFYPRPMDYKQSASGNYSVNDRYLLNMAYLRLKTFTVGYSLPKVWLSKFKVQGLRVYFTGENLFTIDGVKPAIDPEIGIRTASGKSDQRNFGRSYPYQKTVSFGIQLSL